MMPPPLPKSHLATFLLLISPCHTYAQQQNPSEFNGGSILAMAGRNSVAIAMDARFGLGFQTIATASSHHDVDDDGGANNNKNTNNGRILLLPNSNVMMAWTGLYGDGLSFSEEMSVVLARKTRRAGYMGFEGDVIGSRKSRKFMNPRAIAMMMSHLLYRRRSAPYYVEPVVVGLESVRVPVLVDSEEDHDGCVQNSPKTILADGAQNLKQIADRGYNQHQHHQLQSLLQVASRQQNNQYQPPIATNKQYIYRTIQRPYLCTTDMLGAQSTSDSFVCSGLASRSLHGTAEALWKPNLEGDELVKVCGRAFLSALERDCLSGYGAVVYLIRGRNDANDNNVDGDVEILEYVLACRND